MLAVTYRQFGGELNVERVDDPAPPARGAVIRVGATGLCRSDWHGWKGHDDSIGHMPHVPGHEFAGEVVAVGRDVRGDWLGRSVTMPFVCGCGECRACLSGEQQICDHQAQPGFTHWGSFAEYVAVEYADVNLVALPAGMPVAHAAILGCRFPTAFRAVVDQARVQPGDWLVVYGCGGLGLSAVMIAAHSGARVIAVDVADDKLSLARTLGAEATINATTEADPAALVRELTGGGAKVSVDALGSARTCRQAVNSLRKQGRHIQVGLVGGADADPPVPMSRVIAHELEVVGSHGMAAHRFPAMLDMIQSRRLPIEQLIGQRVALSRIPELLPQMERATQPGAVLVDRFA